MLTTLPQREKEVQRKKQKKVYNPRETEKEVEKKKKRTKLNKIK
jgi:hypothetical protein